MTSKKRLLIFAWEYNGYHSKQGTALARRITQVAESFNANGWDVTVIHRDMREECGAQPFVVKTEQNGIRRIPVKLTGILEDYQQNPILRKIETLKYVALHGDRTYKWAKDVVNNYPQMGFTRPDLIIAFYTPRAPLFLGNYFSAKLGVQWIADIQDPVLAGISGFAKPWCRRWMSKTLSTAKAIEHISPEWAATDADLLGLKFHTIRHAIPDTKPVPNPDFATRFRKEYEGYFTIFYGGSLTLRIQSLELLKKMVAYGHANNIRIKILLAANDNVYQAFAGELGEDAVKHLGWLSPDEMNQYLLNIHCSLVVPWSAERVGIPSKFYELCNFGKPVWILGYDLGAFKTLLNEWQHPSIPFADEAYQTQALKKAANGDYSLLFNLSTCKGKYLKAGDLYGEIVGLVG